MSTERTTPTCGASILEAGVYPAQVPVGTGVAAQDVNFELSCLCKWSGLHACQVLQLERAMQLVHHSTAHTLKRKY